MGNKRKSSSDIDRDSDASSGYFSAFDQTDFEDVGTVRRMPAAPRVPLVSGSHQGVSPMIARNNLVLKEPNSVAGVLQSWNLNPPLDVVPPSQLVFLQTVIPTSDCSSRGSDKLKESRKHVPMSSTFPKMASTVTEQDLSGFKRNTSHGQQNRTVSVKPDTSEMFESSFGDISQAVTSLDDSPDLQDPHTTTSPFQTCCDVEEVPEALSPGSSKRKRFCNTYNILNRSGLLGITLRTKELIRQNKRSQAQLQNLQNHTELFLEAICTGDPAVFSRLQLVLQDSERKEKTEVDACVE